MYGKFVKGEYNFMENEKLKKMKEYLKLKRNQDEQKYYELIRKVYKDVSKNDKSDE